MLDNDFSEILQIQNEFNEPDNENESKEEEKCTNSDDPLTETTSIKEDEESFVNVPEPESFVLNLQEHIPSAPVFDEQPLLVRTPNIVSAPTLESPSRTELTKMHRMNEYFVNIAGLKPLTSEQLRVLYHNPYMGEAEQLENDFVEAELHRDVKSEKHILHELLCKYATSRHNLKVNILDINEGKVAAQKQFQQLWTESRKCVKSVARCEDSRRCNLEHFYK